MQPDNTENTKDILPVSAALEATRTTLKLTLEQLAEAKEREGQLLRIVEAQTRQLGNKPLAGGKWVAWIAILVLAGLAGAGALWCWQYVRTAPAASPAATPVPPPQSTPSPRPAPDEGRTPSARPKKRLPSGPRPGEVRIPGSATDWCFYGGGFEPLNSRYAT